MGVAVENYDVDKVRIVVSDEFEWAAVVLSAEDADDLAGEISRAVHLAIRLRDGG